MPFQEQQWGQLRHQCLSGEFEPMEPLRTDVRPERFEVLPQWFLGAECECLWDDCIGGYAFAFGQIGLVAKSVLLDGKNG